MIALARARPAFPALGAALLASSLACRDGEPPNPSEPAAAPPVAASPSTAPAAPPSAAPPSAASPSSPASAADSVTFFRVQGVAADDALNIRSRPDSSAPSLGTISAAARGVEGIGAPSVVGAARWQRVRHAGAVGWVNARFLSPDEGVEPTAPPGEAKPASLARLASLICVGTEPFWAIRFGADGSARYEAMGEAPFSSRVAQLRTTPSGAPESFDLLDARQRIYLRAAMRETGRCSDGMSDLLYPYQFTGAGTPGELGGCCRLDKAPPREPRP